MSGFSRSLAAPRLSKWSDAIHHRHSFTKTLPPARGVVGALGDADPRPRLVVSISHGVAPGNFCSSHSFPLFPRLCCKTPKLSQTVGPRFSRQKAKQADIANWYGRKLV